MKDTSSKITIVVPFRNIHGEDHFVDTSFSIFLSSLKLISNCVEEVILVNDHSTDNSSERVTSFEVINWNLLSLQNEKSGKKAALELAIQEAKTEYIWTLDADVELLNFNSLHFQKFQSKLKEDLVILPVFMKSENGLLGIMQTNEWRYLQFLTYLSACLKMPMMCNGANLIFRRQVFIENIETHRTISSGDDMFLLSQVIKRGGDIAVFWEQFVSVEINPVSSWIDSYVQRIRWAGKTSKLPFTKASVLHFFFAFISAIHVLAFVGLFIPSWHLQSAMFLSCKVFLEVICMYCVFSSRMSTKELVVALPQMIVYPFFSLVIFISSLFFVPKWKGRRVSLK